MQQWASLSFVDLSFAICREFVSDNEVPQDDLKKMIVKSYQVFDTPEVVPVKKVGDNYIAELFHGPTFAFKDIALQFVGSLLDYFLTRRNQRMTILVATSGDTGSAAIYGIRGKKNVECFVLYPKGRISPIQERQMTTVFDENVHVISMDCPSDDLDDVVKVLFNDLEFKKKYNLCSINSINWVRIMMQMVHYFFSYFRVREQITSDKNSFPEVVFSIPTGAFGNGTAGLLAKLMGLPAHRLLIATNENDILYRFFESGDFERTNVVQTVSPSIDIQVPYNFERLMYYLTNGDSEKIKKWMDSFQKENKLIFEKSIWDAAKSHMWSSSVNSQETVETMKKYYEEFHYLLDPHSAVGVKAAQKMKDEVKNFPVICLATADPCKFALVVRKAIDKDPPLPPSIVELEKKDTKFAEFSSDKAEAEKRLRVMIHESF